MIFDTTYPNPETVEEINKLVGRPFGFKEIWKMGSIGSKRMRIVDQSKKFLEFVNHNNDTVNASIALRPRGVLVSVNRNYKNLSWAIPFYKLVIYKTEVLSVHADGQFLKLKIGDKQTRTFIRKILMQKEEYLRNFSPE
jgi:hypothetical protein